LARKLEQEPLSYCKIIAESEGFNQWGSVLTV
jgi:hypothetical protein